MNTLENGFPRQPISTCVSPKARSAIAAKRNFPSLRDRIGVWWSNWKVRKTGQAMRQLEKSLRDPDYRIAWHANLSMPIYDQMLEHGAEHSTAIKAANETADVILKQFFNA